MSTPAKPDPIKSDVLHSEQHSHLSAEEIARAVARHNREHRREPGTPKPPQKNKAPRS